MGQVSPHYSEVNTKLAVGFNPGALKAREVFLEVNVLVDTDVYPVFDKDLFDVPDDTRADGAPSKPSNIGWKYDSYVCAGHALHDFITKKQRRNASDQIRLEARKVQVLKRRVLNNMEVMAFGSIAQGGILRNPANNGGSNNFDLSNPATADPHGMVVTAINAVEVQCGESPNTIVIGKDTTRSIMQTVQFRDEFKFTREIHTMGDVDLPAELYGLKAIYTEGMINTARKGQAKNLVRLMGDDVWIGYVNPDVNPEDGLQEEVTYGLCIKSDEYSNSWWDDDASADKYEYGMDYVLKTSAKEAGYLCQSVLTP